MEDETAALERDAEEVDPVRSDRDIAPRPAALTESTKPDIFISYRLDPDQSTASALKRLIEGSLDPSPTIFVSGAGGLLPSSIGLKPQLQRAVSQAQVFVAVITPESKEREWIIFEAGAAWGRGQMYAPVLVDTEPNELGTTIGDFVATKADARDKMELLLQTLARTLGVAMKGRFSSRYSAFERHLEQRRPKVSSDVPSKGPPDDNRLNRALALWNQGEKDEALIAFSEAEDTAASSEERADAIICRLSLEKDGPQFRDALDDLPDTVRATASWQSWRGIVEHSAHRALQYFDSIIAMTSARPSDLRFAYRGRVERLCALGKREEALRAAMERLNTSESSESVGLVTTMLESCDDLAPRAKLLLIARVLPYAEEDIFRRLTDLAIEEEWLGIAIFAARSYKRKSDTNSAMNSLGRAYHKARYMSLAHESYREALAAGASIARVNLAICLTHGAVPGAAVALLNEYKGDYESIAPALPYEVRATAEKLVADEKEKANATSRRGWKAMNILGELTHDPASWSTNAPRRYRVTSSDESWNQATLSIVSPFAGIYEAVKEGECQGFFVPTSDPTKVRGVSGALDGRVEPERCELIVQPG